MFFTFSEGIMLLSVGATLAWLWCQFKITDLQDELAKLRFQVGKKTEFILELDRAMARLQTRYSAGQDSEQAADQDDLK